jgi:hypothetical protein
MASVYAIDKVKIDYRQYYDFNLNEGLIGKVLFDEHQQVSANVKNFHGKNIVEHIGEWFVGRRLLKGEPHYEQFEMYDPDVKYNSKDGSLYE